MAHLKLRNLVKHPYNVSCAWRASSIEGHSAACAAAGFLISTT
jgi:hypothetical protein